MTFRDRVLPSKRPIAYIDVRVFAHATEDPEKVLTAARNMLPAESIESVSFNQANLTGHHGNPIVLYEARIKEKNLVNTFFAKLCQGLSVLNKEQLGSDLEQHLDRNNLYIRLDKQSAYLNEIRLGSTDPIHLRIHFKRHGTNEVVSALRQLGLLP